jgi:general secretion pathway protein C
MAEAFTVGPMRPLFVAVLASSVLAACGGGVSATANVAAPSTAQPASPAAPAAPVAAAEPAPDHALRRSAVRGVVQIGLGYFLQKVVLDDHPVMQDGRFHGFRIAALRDSAFWRGVDVKPGDVIVRVNGLPIEHPEEALEAFRSLEVASELRVEYERDGKPRELRYAIVDDEPQKRADASVP